VSSIDDRIALVRRKSLWPHAVPRPGTRGGSLRDHI